MIVIIIVHFIGKDNNKMIIIVKEIIIKIVIIILILIKILLSKIIQYQELHIKDRWILLVLTREWLIKIIIRDFIMKMRTIILKGEILDIKIIIIVYKNIILLIMLQLLIKK